VKWDYSSVTVWGIDQNGPDGEDIFTREVAALAQSLSCQIESEKTLNGYQQGFKLLRGEELICQAFTGGTGSAEGSSQFIAASTADEVYPLLQDRFPGHGVSRLDAAEDFCGDGTWDRMEAMLTAIAAQHRVSMAPFGEGHRRPDGTRDVTRGRSWYFGSKSSTFRVVLYEKGLEQIAKGIPADPTWVRLEVRVRPSSKARASSGKSGLFPSICSACRAGASISVSRCKAQNSPAIRSGRSGSLQSRTRWRSRLFACSTVAWTTSSINTAHPRKWAACSTRSRRNQTRQTHSCPQRRNVSPRRPDKGCNPCPA